MAKQHQTDRENSRGYLVKALCGRSIPEGNQWGLESCEACARVARARLNKVVCVYCGAAHTCLPAYVGYESKALCKKCHANPLLHSE